MDPFRRQPSGIGTDGRGWEVHYDPYDISRIWVRNHHASGWIPAIWRHLRTAPTPMGELAWDHARRILARRGTDPATEEEIAQAAVVLLDRAADGPEDKPANPAGTSRRSRRDRKVAARTRATSEPAWPRPVQEPPQEAEPASADEEDDSALAEVVPLEIFDARKEAQKWW